MNQQEQEIQGLHNRIAQLQNLLVDTTQEKMDIKNQIMQMQQNMMAATNGFAADVNTIRSEITLKVKDKELAKSLCAVFDKAFGPFQSGAQNAVDQNTVA